MQDEYYICKGFGLLEMLFVLSISGILFLMMIQIYISVKQNNQFQQANANRLERAGLANRILRASIRQAGFIGCPALMYYPDFPPVDDSQLLSPANDQMMQVYRAVGHNWQPTLPTTIAGKVKVGSDVIKVQQLGPILSSVQQNMKSNHQVVVSAVLNFRAGNTVMISDCGHVDIFKVASVHAQEGLILLNSTNELSYRYHQYAAVGFIETQIFYIRESPLLTQPDEQIFSLYLNDGSNLHEELVVGIEEMHIQVLSNNLLEKPLVKIRFNVKPFTTDRMWKGGSDHLIADEWQVMVALR